MKKVILVLGLLLAATIFVSNQSYAEDNWTGNINVSYGNKTLNQDDWSLDEENLKMKLNKQRETSIDVDFGKESWPIHIALGYLSSIADDSFTEEVDYEGNLYDVLTEFEGSTRELRLGIKWIWDSGNVVHEYLGGGLAMINAKVKATASAEGVSASESDDDQAAGFYINGGIFWTIARHLNIGIDVGYSQAEVTFDKMEADMKAGGGHYGLFLGYHW
jgi:opacity protein-like surface antigen